IADHPVEGDQRDDRRQEHRRDDPGKHPLAPAEPVLGERKPGEQAGEQNAGRGDRGDDRRVEERAAGIDDVRDLAIGVEAGRRWGGGGNNTGGLGTAAAGAWGRGSTIRGGENGVPPATTTPGVKTSQSPAIGFWRNMPRRLGTSDRARLIRPLPAAPARRAR